MTRWPDPDRAVIVRYLAGLRLHSANSRTYYRQVLHSFQDVAERYAGLDRHVLVVWVRESAARWSASTLVHRTRIVDRFLDHLVQTGLIDQNPIAVLRAECNIKQCRPIWRALASSRPDRALPQLRQPKPFGSVLGEIMSEHVALMRGRGYKYATQAPYGSCGSTGSCS